MYKMEVACSTHVLKEKFIYVSVPVLMFYLIYHMISAIRVSHLAYVSFFIYSHAYYMVRIKYETSVCNFLRSLATLSSRSPSTPPHFIYCR
jgi:hypothetical protein